MEMENTKKLPEYGDRMHNGNGRSDRCTKIGFLAGWSAMEIWNIRTYLGFFEELGKTPCGISWKKYASGHRKLLGTSLLLATAWAFFRW